VAGEPVEGRSHSVETLEPVGIQPGTVVPLVVAAGIWGELTTEGMRCTLVRLVPTRGGWTLELETDEPLGGRSMEWGDGGEA
jgi:hypothetical protein